LRVVRSAALALCAAAVALAGCGSDNPAPPAADKAPHPAAPQAFNPVPAMLGCLGGRGVQAKQTDTYRITVEPASAGMRIRFAPTPADADADQLRGQVEGAEVVQRIVFYTGSASDAQLNPVEQCVNEIAQQST
jgi:hypothetical protein